MRSQSLNHLVCNRSDDRWMNEWMSEWKSECRVVAGISHFTNRIQAVD